MLELLLLARRFTFVVRPTNTATSPQGNAALILRTTNHIYSFNSANFNFGGTAGIVFTLGDNAIQASGSFYNGATQTQITLS